MIKKILTLALALVFGFSGVSFANAVVMTDSAMDGVSAGEWVILSDGEGNQTTADVYLNNNTLWLLEESQKDIQAVSNANAIDSAVAVQSNIASVNGDNAPTDNVAVNGANVANLTNYRPASSSAESSVVTSTVSSSSKATSGSASEASKTLNASSNSNAASSSSASSGAALNYDEELSVLGNLNGTSKEIGKNGITGGTIVGSLVVDYDKEITATASAASASASAESKTCALTAAEQSASSSYATEESSTSTVNTTETSHETRDSKGANNHILLDAASQQNIQAVSNLNAVASGVAVQNNIASNVGVSGSISGSNTATVSSGF